MYNKVLIIGATSGIGWSLADALVSQGTPVLLVGRRTDKLDEFTKTHSPSANLITTYTFNITDLPSIPSFINDITTSHPDLDSVILNAGIQRPFDFTSPSGLSSTDLNTFNTELTTNYTAHVHLTSALVPFLQRHPQPTSLIYISATLSLVPGLLRTPGYNASKAALHTFILNLREQLRRSQSGDPSNVKIIEIFPPAVRTELHDTKHQPDMVNGDQIGIPLEQFTDSCLAGSRQIQEGKAEGQEEFLVDNDGQVKWMGEMFPFEVERQGRMRRMADMLEDGLKKFLKPKE